jgi:hypothetical protein
MIYCKDESKGIYKYMKLKLIFFVVAGLFLFACGYKLPESSSDANRSSNSANQNAKSSQNDNMNAGVSTSAGSNGAAVSKDSDTQTPLILTDSNESSTYPCNGREIQIDESTTAKNYFLTGECKKLTVDGVSNTVNVEKVGEIVVKGTSNKVVYGDGLSGKKPKITKSGVSTAVDSKKSFEEKKEKQSQIK